MDVTRIFRIGCWVVVGGLLALGQCRLCAQQSKIPWSGQSSGFAVSNTVSLKAISSAGQMAVGVTLNSGLTIESGFLADTSLRQLILAVHDEKGLPLAYALEQNYPNPFNPVTSIQYSVVTSQYVTLQIYDILGKEVQTLVNEEKPVGTYTVKWDGGGYPSGVYFYRIHAGNFVQSKKLLLMK